MSQKNKTKKLILQFLKMNSPRTAREIEGGVSLEIHNVYNCLRRLHISNLVRRDRLGQGGIRKENVYSFNITPKGDARLVYYEELAKKKKSHGS